MNVRGFRARIDMAELVYPKIEEVIDLARDYLLRGYARRDAVDAACCELSACNDETKKLVMDYISRHGAF